MNLNNKSKLALIVVFALVAQFVFVGAVNAQYKSDINSEIDSEIDQIGATPSNNKAVETLPSKSSSAATPVVTQTIYAVPSSSPSATAQLNSVSAHSSAAGSQPYQASQSSIQKQPETVVEASPLNNSRAESIRRGRQEEEMRTESRIVEKLEQSRLEDEKKRASVLFGDKFEQLQNNANNQGQQVQTAPAQPVQIQQQAQPAVQVAPQPIIINQNESLTRDAVREEVRAALSEDQKAITPSLEQKYFSAHAGVGQYPDINAIKGNYALGAALGTRFDYFLVEGAFVYSNYTVTAKYTDYMNPTGYSYADFDMNQYQGYVAAKYQLLGGFVRPTLGGLLSYSYRKYIATSYTALGSSGSEVGSSHAVDFGLVTGVDFEFNDKMSMGVDFKYMFNMSSKLSGSAASPGQSTPEKLQYFTTGVFARVNF